MRINEKLYSPLLFFLVLIIPLSIQADPIIDSVHSETVCRGGLITIIGEDFAGTKVVFTQGASTFEVFSLNFIRIEDSSVLSPDYITVALPLSIMAGTVDVVVEENGGDNAKSNAVTLIVTNGQAPLLPAIIGDDICENDSLILKVGNANPSFDYLWYTDSTFASPTVTDSVFKGAPVSSDTTIFLVVQSGAFCRSNFLEVDVTVRAYPAAPSIATVSICKGEATTLNASGPGSFQWYRSASLDSLLDVGNSFNTGQLTADTSFWVTEMNGNCEGPATEVMVTVWDNPTANAGANFTVCEGDPATLEASATEGQAPYTYEWLDVGSSQSVSVMPFEDTTFTVMVTDANGCQDDDRIDLNIRLLPVVESLEDMDPSDCGVEDGEITVNVMGDASTFEYRIFKDGSVFDSWDDFNSYDSLPSGQYRIQLRYRSGQPKCPAEVFTTLTDPNAPNATITTLVDSVCVGEMQTFEAQSVDGANFSWNFGDEAVPETAEGIGPHAVVFNVEGTRDVILTVEEEGCKANDFIALKVKGKPILTIEGDAFLQDGDTTLISFSSDIGVTTISRSFSGQVNETVINETENELQVALKIMGEQKSGTATYTFLTTDNGCTDTVVWEILVSKGLPDFVIPALLTPNGDGKNDTWKIGIPPTINVPDYTLQIFNRSGSVIFENSLETPWDGGNAPSGAYYFVIKNTVNSAENPRTGGITLLRE